MELRPHHLLCIQKFTGHGYSADFTAYMKSVVSELKDNPETRINIVKGCDNLCEICPNNVRNVCTSPDKVSLMDSSVMNICNLTYGENASWAELAGKAWTRILETDEFNKICSSCQWFELCRRTEV